MIDLYSELRLGSLPGHAARHWGEREALVFEDGRWTFADLDREVDRHAWALVEAGLGPGDHVALWFTNRPAYIVLLFAIAKIGAVAVPLNTRYRRQDIAYCLAQAHCTALIYAESSGPVDYREMVESVLADAEPAADGLRSPAFPRLRRLVTIGPSTSPLSVPLDTLLATRAAIDREALADAGRRCGPTMSR